jgi:kynurenine 3-monooxygenase
MGMFFVIVCISMICFNALGLLPKVSQKISSPLKNTRIFSSVSTLEIPSTTSIATSPSTTADAVIIGSGPIGLAAAISLAQRGFQNIKVFDQLTEPVRPDDANYWGKFRSERSYNIGITGRGQLVLQKLGVWDYVQPFTAEVYGGAEYATPETPITSPRLRKQERRYLTHCLERDRLVACLIQAIRHQYANQIEVMYSSKCQSVQWETKEDEYASVLIDQNNTSNRLLQVNTSFLIGCDGSNSIVRDILAATATADSTTNMSPFLVKRYEDTNEYVYRTIPIQFDHVQTAPSVANFCPSDKHLSYSFRSPTKVGLNLECLPTVEGVQLGVMLFRPNNEYISNLTTIEDVKSLFQTHFPATVQGLSNEALTKFLTQKNNRFQRFQYVYPQVYYGTTTCLLGDAIHTVKPYFGLGVNAGLEDVGTLHELLGKVTSTATGPSTTTVEQGGKQQEILTSKLKYYQQATIRKSIFQQFNKARAPEAKALVTMSQRMDRGFIYFILPIIIDSFFHKYFPKIFQKSLVACMQDERLKFTDVLRRKQLDRIMQLTVVVGVIMASLHTLRMTLTKLVIPGMQWLLKKFLF